VAIVSASDSALGSVGCEGTVTITHLSAGYVAGSIAVDCFSGNPGVTGTFSVPISCAPETP
jgi:hypothetical protein